MLLLNLDKTNPVEKSSFAVETLLTFACFMPRPWSTTPINDCGEQVVKIPSLLHCLEPHPYLSLGAPYGDHEDPFSLREGVIKRLLFAQNQLKSEHPELKFAIFDAWRPVSVQAFMFEHSISHECIARGIDRNETSHSSAFEQVCDEVGEFWAAPSLDLRTPPPHSTGGAFDITLANLFGKPLFMGGKIDEIGDVSQPSYYREEARLTPNSKAFLWNQRRHILSKVLTAAGFVQHPNEWWHFSYGDQLWAWRVGKAEAIYGSFSPLPSKEFTA